MAMINSLCLVVTLLTWCGVLSLPGGPPVSDHHPNLCTTMSPVSKHLPRNDTLRDPGPYKISFNSTSSSPGTQVQVILEADPGVTFRGFFVQARCADCKKDDALGSFSNIPQGSQLLPCTSDAGAWGHSNPNRRSRVVATWTPPADNVDNIVFQATVVQGPADVWWEEIRSVPFKPPPSAAAKSSPGLYVTLAATFLALKLILWRQ